MEGKNNKKRVNLIYSDGSTVFEKIRLMERNEYFKRTRWERATVIDVLEKDSDYVKHMTDGKLYCGTKKDQSVFGHTVEASLYTDATDSKMLYATVAHRNESPATSPNEEYVNATSDSENFVFSSLFPNMNICTETAYGGVKKHMMQGAQLYRYDPVGKGIHNNLKKVYDIIEKNYGARVCNFYKRFFQEKVDFPHFHFSNRTMAESYGKTADANAISLDRLIDYIEYLMLSNNKNHPINNCDFGMPYVDIKNHPQKYKTAINFNGLQDALAKGNVNEQLDKIFMQTQKLDEGTRFLYGLDAVYADLVLLRILRGMEVEHAGSALLSKFINIESGKMGKCQSARRFHFMGDEEKIPYMATYVPENLDRRLERDNDKPEVSMAELQVASKIATGGNMNLKNLNGRDKMHFDEARSHVDLSSWYMLHNILYLCQNPTHRRKNDEPVFE